MILSPASGDILSSTNVTVKWQEQVSSGYQVEFSQSASFPSRNTKKFRTDLYTHEYTYEDIPEGTWYVRVAAKKEGGLTDYSNVVTFTVDITSGLEDNYISDRPIKTMENGQMFILRNGKRYNILGHYAQ